MFIQKWHHFNVSIFRELRSIRLKRHLECLHSLCHRIVMVQKYHLEISWTHLLHHNTTTLYHHNKIYIYNSFHAKCTPATHGSTWGPTAQGPGELCSIELSCIKKHYFTLLLNCPSGSKLALIPFNLVLNCNACFRALYCTDALATSLGWKALHKFTLHQFWRLNLFHSEEHSTVLP